MFGKTAHCNVSLLAITLRYVFYFLSKQLNVFPNSYFAADELDNIFSESIRASRFLYSSNLYPLLDQLMFSRDLASHNPAGTHSSRTAFNSFSIPAWRASQKYS